MRSEIVESELHLIIITLSSAWAYEPKPVALSFPLVDSLKLAAKGVVT